jgi:hypothetical protein
MRFDETYQSLEVVEDGDVKAFSAVQAGSGQKVSIFLFEPGAARENDELLKRLRTVDQLQFPELIEVGQYRDATYVATLPLAGFAELKLRVSLIKTGTRAPSVHKPEDFSKGGIWRIPPSLQAALKNAGKQPLAEDAAEISPETSLPMDQKRSEAAGVTAPPAPDPGEFTQMFQVASGIADEKPPRTQETPAQAAPGEFTRMFQSASKSTRKSTGESPHDVPAVSAPATHSPGEFTKFFNASEYSSSGTPPVSSRKPSSEGEFARIFGDDSSDASSPYWSGAVDTPSNDMLENNAPGTGTAHLKPPASHTASAGEFTRIFGSEPLESPAQLPDLSSPAATASSSPAEAPGDYTRIFGVPAAPSQPMASPSPAPVATPAPSLPLEKSSKPAIVFIGIALFLIAVIALFLLLMTKS